MHEFVGELTSSHRERSCVKIGAHYVGGTTSVGPGIAGDDRQNGQLGEVHRVGHCVLG